MDPPVQMKHSEAKRLIIEEWDRWIRHHAADANKVTGRDTLRFFVELEDARSPILNFPTRGRDKWQIIHDWLLDPERIHIR
jgi:hypothetical protein